MPESFIGDGFITDIQGQPKSYGVERVTGDVAEPFIPTVINRTVREQLQLREFLFYGDVDDVAIDIGCGYGRMLPLLKDFFFQVMGLERDDVLREIAKKLNPECELYPWRFDSIASKSIQLVLTYTVAQHLTDQQFVDLKNTIHRILNPGGFWIAVEFGFHESQFGLEVISIEDRVKEPTNEKLSTGKLFVLRMPL